MAISFIVKASIQLHCRAIFIPWVQKYSAISCSRGRDYSAFPVKHIPKKSKECQELEAASPRKPFLDIEKQSYVDRNVQETEFSVGGRLKNGGISFDSKSQNHKQRLLTSIDNEVEWGKEDEVNGRAETDKARVDAERIAVQLLASRALTAAELKKKLLGRKFTISVVNAVITDFHTRGLINDSLYAEMFSRSRWSSSSWGPRRIKQALIKKGVSEADANKAVKLVFKNDEAGEEDGSGESRVTMSRPSRDQLFVQTSKQWLKGQGVPREKRKARIVRWLQYRGFDWSVVSFILKKLESSYPE
ncbi:PREDICTED: uncharacterized protein LOC109229041 [Nicotiana attenuata]|uniref:Regulatory protein RecX n=1 Tax=Nicotiana attenuata TaxID=49451 RepID=A0A1J6I6C3_NICAT|nr:PREDICTED: uncharacterized protein LOC109229041 [Nicotiana attenuata]OIT00565.1 hypothetical protein A4A49_23893 [Nicotiana attenuata]